MTSVHGQTAPGKFRLYSSMKTLFWPFLASLDQRWGRIDQSSLKDRSVRFVQNTPQKARAEEGNQLPGHGSGSHWVPRSWITASKYNSLSSVSDHACWISVEFGKRMGWAGMAMKSLLNLLLLLPVWGGAWGSSLVAQL